MQSFKLSNTVEQFDFGNPIDTGALEVQGKPARIDFDEKLLRGKTSTLTFELGPKDCIYGLGEQLGSINRRGGKFRSYCRDEANHTEDKNELYGAHNFFVHLSEQGPVGWFIDFPGEVIYDIGFENEQVLKIEISGKDFRIVKISGSGIEDVVSDFLKVIGKAYIPPKWGFGYFQSRWGYKDMEEIRQVSRRFKEEEIPLEGIFLDLDYMEDFKNFTVSRERFPEFEKFVQELKAEGVYLIPIIDAGIKIEAGYNIFEEGIAGKHFCLDAKGNPYVAAVWPGKVHFPDFLQAKTRTWFGEKYKFLTDLGIEGVWNDMNEPAIFYDEKNLEAAVNLATDYRGENLDVHKFFALKDTFANLLNDENYHQRFYHNLEGVPRKHKDVHNLYGDYMTRAAYEGLKNQLGRRFLLISRASAIGMHRYGGIWTGDNASWWTHLEENIRMMPSINMCGFYYIGADTGGFGGQCSGELLVRWLQFSAFTPLLRNHSALDTREQEPYAFSDEVTKHARTVIRCRYRLIPYLYSTFMQKVEQHQLFFKPLAFEYPKAFEEVEDQLLIGDEIMLTPIYRKNQTRRLVDLPEKMALVTLTEEKTELTLVGEGTGKIHYEPHHLRFFLRENKMIPLGPAAKNVSELALNELDILAFVTTASEYIFYEDDGESLPRKHPNLMKIAIVLKDGSYDIQITQPPEALETLNFKIIDGAGKIRVIRYAV